MFAFIKKHWRSGLKLALLAAVVSGVTFGFGELAHAQLAIPSQGELEGIPKEDFAVIVLRMVNFFIGFLGFLATLAFVYAGVLWILSGGSEETITKAKKIMTYAALGIIVIILSFSIVRFITQSAGTSPAVDEGDGAGEPGTGVPGVECVSDTDCNPGEICIFSNSLNEFICQASGVECESNNECDPGDVCVNNVCVLDESNAETSDPDENVPEGEEELGDAEEQADGVGEDTQDLSDQLDQNLDDETQGEVDDAIDEGGLDQVDENTPGDEVIDTIEDTVENLEDILDDPESELTPEEREAIENLIRHLDRLRLLRDALDRLRETMPESLEIVAAYDKASAELNELIADPLNATLARRFERDFRELKELIRKFPVVVPRIRALPGAGNVPFTVQLDGLDSVDPTGGTISEYRWSFLDNNGNEVSLGSDPVVTYEFDEPNTYAVRLRASTSNVDSGGYKTAADATATIRVRANPPTSDVRFRINGNEVRDFYHVTLQEAQAGLAFDPSPTTPAVGRTIEKFEWSYGDTSKETRNQPTTVVHTYENPGEYFVKLVTTDSLGIQDRRIVKLFVKSLAASIQVNPRSGNVNTEFVFSGLHSRSDDGVIRDFEWEIRDDQGVVVAESAENSFHYRFEAPGTYQVTLLVTDVTGASDKIVEEMEVLSRAPSAAFNFEVPEQNHPNRVQFNAVDSYDPDQGDTITYSWDFDGDGSFDVIDSEDNQQTFEYERVGDYRVTLEVQDKFGKRNQIKKTVSVDSILSADITSSIRATRVGEEVTFTAESPNAIAYLWEFGDGKTQSTEEKTVTHTYEKNGKFTVRLNFFDRDDNDNFDTQRLLVGVGEEPLAVINQALNGREPRLIEDLCGEDVDGVVVTRADLIRFEGRNSINTDGSSRLLSYDWRLPGGEKSSNREVNYKFDEVSRPGECFEVSLVVRDQLSGKLSQEDTAYYKVINKVPQITDFVVEGPDAEELVTPAVVKLRVINPTDSDGTIKKYKWWYYREGFDDDRLGVHNTAGPSTEMIITSFGQPDVENRYFFAVEIVDNDNGVFDAQERFGEVSYLDIQNGPNLSPVAEFTVDKTTISVGDSITFVSKSYDPQGDDLPNDAFRWDFNGNGEFDDTSSGAQVNRQYNTPGEYEVRLKVVHRGLSSSASRVVYVEPTSALPQAAFTYEIDGNTVEFDGGHSRFDPDLIDTTLRYEWDFDIETDSNGNGISDDDVQATDIRPSFEYEEKQLYRVKLTVLDVLGSLGVVVRDVDLGLTEAERQADAYQSLKVSSPRHALTTLDLSVIPALLEKGGSADLNVLVLNADGTPYEGQVFFEVLEGSGEFTPNPVTAIDSRASAIFTATDAGKVRIRVRAVDTVFGDLEEEAFIQVE